MYHITVFLIKYICNTKNLLKTLQYNLKIKAQAIDMFIYIFKKSLIYTKINNEFRTLNY